MLATLKQQPLGGGRLSLSPHDAGGAAMGEGEEDDGERATSPVAEAQIETWLATATAQEEEAGGRHSNLGVLEEQEESETEDDSEYSYYDDDDDDDEYDDGYEDDLLLETPASMAPFPGSSPPPALTPMRQPVADWPDLTLNAPTPSPAQAAAQAKNTYVDPILAQIRASQTPDTGEVFQQPTDRERMADGVSLPFQSHTSRTLSLTFWVLGTLYV